MKRLFLLAVTALVVTTAYCQRKDVTTFEGVSIDGTEKDMRSRLRAKYIVPFRHEDDPVLYTSMDPFGPTDILLGVNKQGKVYSVTASSLELSTDEALIVCTYNYLVKKFKKSKNYIFLNGCDTIPWSEFAFYNLRVDKDKYKQTFYQVHKSEEKKAIVNKRVGEVMKQLFTEKELRNPSQHVIDARRKTLAEISKDEFYYQQPVTINIRCLGEGRHQVELEFVNRNNQP